TGGKRYQQSRLGWAAQTLGETCYESNGRPPRYSSVCERRYSWGTATEDYVLPQAHTVAIHIAPEQHTAATGDCIWSWHPRKPGGKTESKRITCTDKLVIPRVPYALDRANSGVSVTSACPTGANSPSRRWWSRISSLSRWAILLLPEKAIPIDPCNSAPGAKWCMSRPCCAPASPRE